jgi:hypothetical protein
LILHPGEIHPMPPPATFVPGVEYDVFISYSHDNNYEQWATKFRQKLEGLLKDRLGRGVRIFFDESGVAPNEDLTPEIQRAVSNSALFVPIVSHNYVTKTWCRRECELFENASGTHAVSGRIFPVRYDDVPYDAFQKLIGEKVGFEFFSIPEGATFPATLEIDSPAFKIRMNDLRLRMIAKLQECRDHQASAKQENAAPPSATSDSDRPSLFLAEPAPGLQDRALQLQAFFQGIGYEVRRAGAGFKNGGPAAQYQKELHPAQAFVQLLGRNYDPHDDETVHSWDRWQWAQAREAPQPPAVHQWFQKFGKDGQPIDLTRLEAGHREFVTQPGVWDCDFGKFLDMVRDDVARRHHDLRQARRAAVGENFRPLIIVRADRSDRDHADESIGKMLNSLSCEWLRIPDKQIQSLDEFARAHAANGLLVVYRACPGNWVLARLQELRSFVRSEFGSRWVCGLWRDPEDDEDALSCSIDGLRVINPRQEATLNEFISQLKRQGMTEGKPA